MSCGKCSFWCSMSAMVGECRRHPPVVVYDGAADEYKTLWPETECGQWCGAARYKLNPGKKPVTTDETILIIDCLKHCFGIMELEERGLRELLTKLTEKVIEREKEDGD